MKWPEPVLESLYKAYPRKGDKKRCMSELIAALERICAGEIDGTGRNEREAIEYLRRQICAANAQMGSREKKFIPLLTTWLHQSRYLRSAMPVELAEISMRAIAILALYPKMPSQEVIAKNAAAYFPAIVAIEQCLAHQPASYDEYLAERVALYSFWVSQWPKEDLQYVPGPARWFNERRFEQDESQWRRTRGQSWQDDRDQVRRVLGV
jgi:hypothetical protein